MTGFWKKPKFILVFSLFLFSIFGSLFGEIIDEIWFDKRLLPLDLMTSHWMALNQKPYDRMFFLTMTYVGEGEALAVLALIAAAILWFYRRKIEGVLLFGGFGFLTVNVFLIKFLTGRPRPAVASIHEASASFPSAHAALSLFFFGFLTYLLAREVNRKYPSLLILAAGLLITGLIGASRVYLNVHWVSDVFGGFALGAAVLSFCIGFLEMQKSRTSGARDEIAV